MNFLFLLCKRQLKSRSLYLLTGSILLLCALFPKLETTDYSSARIALYASPADSISTKICKKLIEDSASDRSLFLFYMADSPERLREEVATKQAECGFLFPEELFDSVDAGSTRKTISVVTAPDSLLSDVACETVFAAWFEEYELHVLETSMDTLLSNPPYLKQELTHIYHSHLEDGSVFSFSYNATPKAQLLKATEVPDSLLPFKQPFDMLALKRLLYLMLFAACYTGGLHVYQDDACGFYQVISKAQKYLASLSCLLIPLLMNAVALFAGGLFFLPAMTTGSACRSFLLDILTVSGFSLIFCLITLHLFHNEKSYTACLPPLLLLGSILLLV
ncbi:MAG: hypothetical protein GX234_08790 [Clostridiales bacterium]|nr:hypothetical protein [Clostridiales bacterium]